MAGPGIYPNNFKPPLKSSGFIPRGISSRGVPHLSLSHCISRLIVFPLVLFFLGCAGRAPTGDIPSGLPSFQEFRAPPSALSDAAARAVHSSSNGLELDTRHTTPNSLITLHQPLSMKRLKTLAYPGKPGLWGKALHADLHVLLSIRPSYAHPDQSRVTIHPIFLVYVSRWGDNRQWIQWHSNGTLEQELLSLIEVHLQPEGWE